MILLVAHGIFLVLVLTGQASPKFSVWLLARFRDLLLIQAAWLAWQTTPPSPLWLAVAQWPVFYLLLRHARAHSLMHSELDESLHVQLTSLEADVESGILNAEEVSRKEEHARLSHQQACALTGLGMQTGTLAILHLAILLFSSSLPWSDWLLLVNLPALIQSKIQDLLLSDHVPHRLC